MRKNIVLALIAALFIVSCGKKEYDMTVSGNVKGLKKGTLYLQKIQDSVIVNVDSLVIDGDSNFVLGAMIEGPEVFYLQLDKKDADENDDRIQFFGEKGNITINTELREFEVKANVSGSASNELLNEYLGMMREFNLVQLDLFKARFDAQKAEDAIKLDSIEAASNSWLRKRYRYAINFALMHKNSEIAPYIAVNEIYDANPVLLDSINKVLTPEVKASKYGQQLEKLLEATKE